MIIQVKQKHIDEGVKDACEKCPIALALKDVGFKNVSVYVNDYDHDYDTDVTFPQKCQIFIEHFDKGLKVKPFSFRTKKIKE